MSYDIIYGKQFVKLRKTGEVIPMLLSGSNNCYEVGRGGRTGRRTRDWCSMRFYNRKGKVSEKPDVILKNLDAELNRIIRRHRKANGYEKASPAHIQEHFGYYVAIVVGGGHCADTSWNQYRSQFVNGIRGALTIEELVDLGVYLRIDAYLYGEENEVARDARPSSIMLTTERQYFDEMKKWREWQSTFGKTFSFTFGPGDTDTVLARLRQTKRRESKPKNRIEQDHYFVLETDGYVLVKYVARGFRYSPHPSSGKKFRTENIADKYRQQLVAKGRHKADTWKVKRVDMPAVFWN